MNVTATAMSILAIAVLIFGNAVFVAAEFALTTLDRSTVEANARSGKRRDRWIRRAHHRL
jgi:CBS domain containing-hemolysin-like protein